MKRLSAIQSKQVIVDGGVIAYPTEAVYGLGCDPDNLIAIKRILKLKQRSWEKGLILVANHYQKLTRYIDETQLSCAQVDLMMHYWPGAVTFVVPAKKNVTPLLRGKFDSIAVRVSAHPVINDVCRTLKKPLVSTSANLSGMEPAISTADIERDFAGQIDGIIDGELGDKKRPSTIIDIRTNQILR